MSSDRVTINPFRPVGKSLRREVGVIRTILSLWTFLAFGIPLLIWLCGLGDPNGLGESWLTRNRSLFGFPLHYWLIAQGCTIGFLLLCKLYCVLWESRVSHAKPPWGYAPPEDGRAD